MTHRWNDDDGERYWLEITRREDVGEESWHYTENSAGTPSGQTLLLRGVRPGDIALHYDANRSAIVGRSRVSSSAAVDGDDGGYPALSREIDGTRRTPGRSRSLTCAR